ncbi:MAG: hypothetical protein NTZ90_15195 [Proteobacteria bacterium]|nr:hypothetical protein [Pseudomonadota bacterium]
MDLIGEFWKQAGASTTSRSARLRKQHEVFGTQDLTTLGVAQKADAALVVGQANLPPDRGGNNDAYCLTGG